MTTTTLGRPAAAPQKPSANKDWLRALAMTASLEQTPARTLPVVIDELADRFGDAPALLSDRERFSFNQLADRSRRYARWAADQGLAAGDVVALIMPNRPEYMAIWLGLSRLGVITALINTQLRGASLAHCLTVAKARHIIVDATLMSGLAEVAQTLEGAPRIWLHGEVMTDWRIDLVVDGYGADALAALVVPEVTLSDRALLIYTSGTTGLPKAANVSHHRLMSWSHWFAGLMDVQPTDRLYDCLPMYHSAGGVAAIGAALVGGASVVIGREVLRQPLLGRHRALRTAPCSSTSASCAATWWTRRRIRWSANTSLRLCCGNGLVRRCVGGVPGKVRDPADTGVLRRHRGQFLALQRRGKARRDRPRCRASSSTASRLRS